ncbi:hypothetical protein QZH41_014942 [Actinostola sp. cb2023]|nr:hypothetical protein QZH41_014942 [Actinostola sp. cb2023]
MSDKKRVVAIAVDGSDYSSHAVEFYKDKVRKEGDSVVFIYVTEPVHLPVVTFKSGFNVPHEQWADIMKKRNEVLINIESDCEATKREIKEKDKTFESVVKHISDSEPGPGIVLASKEHNAELIILGTRGMNTLRRTFIGSVSDYVLHHSTIPVAIVPPAQAAK